MTEGQLIRWIAEWLTARAFKASSALALGQLLDGFTMEDLNPEMLVALVSIIPDDVTGNLQGVGSSAFQGLGCLIHGKWDSIMSFVAAYNITENRE